MELTKTDGKIKLQLRRSEKLRIKTQLDFNIGKNIHTRTKSNGKHLQYVWPNHDELY